MKQTNAVSFDEGAPAAREKAWSASSRIGGALARSIRSRCSVVLIDYCLLSLSTTSANLD
jgi:hypothetical protein